jgi:hypothetical protein
LATIGTLVVLGVLLAVPCVACGLFAVVNSLRARASAPPQQQAKTVNPPSRTPIPPAGVVRISVDELLARFGEDPDAADRTFRDRTVEVTGKAFRVWSRRMGELVVDLGSSSSTGSRVECNTLVRYADAKVVVGQSCVIRGTCMGCLSKNSTWLKECVFASAEP